MERVTVRELRTLLDDPLLSNAKPVAATPTTQSHRVRSSVEALISTSTLTETVRQATGPAPWWLEKGVPSNWLANPLSLQTAFVNAAMQRTLKAGQTLYKNGVEGTPTVTPTELLQQLTKDGWRVALVRCPMSEQETHLCMDLVQDSGVLVLEMTAGDLAYGSYATTDAALAERTEKLLRSVTKNTPPEGAVYALVNQGSGISLMSLGRVNTPLNRANYTPDVMAAFDRVVAELQTEQPNGRLVVLEGPPGTGKSFWVRGLVQSTSDATFVLIPPDMVGSLAHPGLLPVLARHRTSHRAPVVLILEDAEACLLPRKEGSLNAGAVSTLLNLADGIFGQLLDVRIVATTNTKKVDFDAAFLRPGRLSEVVTFGSLDPVRARELLLKLVPGMPKTAMPTQALSLAEVYQLARKAGWKPPRSSPRGGTPENKLHTMSKRLSYNDE